MEMNENWNLLGHDWAVNLLKNNLADGRIRHAYLFTGPQGIGRRTIALRLAQGINCVDTKVPGSPCGECRACRLIEKMEHPDLTIVQAENVGGNLRVNQIRELQRSLNLSPYESKYRIALILRFEEANPSASNALLKTLEEPPSRVVMMLTAQDAESLLPTIVSRCEVINLRSLAIKTVSTGLQTQYGIASQDAELLAHISEGRPGHALNYLKDPDLISERQSGLEKLGHLLAANRVERFATADGLSKHKDGIGDLLKVWSSFWRDVLLVRSGASVPVTNMDWDAEIKHLSSQLDLQKIKEMIKLIDRTQHLLHRNINTRLALEVLMLNLPYVKAITQETRLNP